MNARQKKKTVRKLESLRTARLQLAELHTANARRAEAEAIARLEQERQRLREAVVFSRAEYQRLDLELAQRTAIDEAGLFDWQTDRKNVAAQVVAARDNTKKAEQLRAQRAEAVKKAQEKQRAATVNVERVHILISRTK